MVAMARNSISIDDLETMAYFFDFQEMRESLMKIQYPVFNCRVSGHVNLSHRKPSFEEEKKHGRNDQGLGHILCIELLLMRLQIVTTRLF